MFVDSRFDYMSQVRYYASFVVTPIHWLADVPEALSSAAGEQLRTRDQLLQENAELKEQLLQQQYELQTLAHLSSENRRLNGLLNASTIVDEKVVRAQLTGEAPDPYRRRVLINRGARDDVFVGQPVLDAFGLMGQVVAVEPYSSWVLLVTDPQHATPVQVNRNGVRAIVAGSQGSLNELDVRNLPTTSDIEVGDLLVTSGLGQRFPPGYPVGVVTSIEHDPGQPFAIIKARPSAQLERSRNLLLVF